MATSNQDGPDPTGAKTAAEFMQLLREARNQSGLAFVEIAQRARDKGYDLSSTTVAEALEGDRLPEWQVVTGVLAACGYAGMQIDRWMRVYHDLAAPAQPVSAVPVAAAAAVTAAQEPIDVEPISVPPLVLNAAPAASARLGPKHFALAAAVLAALIVVPLMLFSLFSSEPSTVAGEPTGTAPRTSQAVPSPSPTDLPVVQPSPTEVVAPTTPAPVTTTVRPPTRTSAPPAPPPPPPPPPGDPGVLRSGVVALIDDQGFDLDSGQIGGEHDFRRWDNDTLVRANGGRLEPMPDGMPTKQACAAERGWENWVEGLAAGQWLCAYTSDGRLARLNITAVGTTLKLAYVVWT